jgi:hypothetical protein
MAFRVEREPPMSTALHYLRTARRLPADPALRGVTAVGLITTGVIHAVEVQGELGGAVWLTIGFGLLAVVAPLAGLWLLVQPTRPAWIFAGLVGLLAALAYMATRTVGLPGDHNDIGNWLEPLGLVALITEWLVVILAGLALGGARENSVQAAENTAAETREMAR